VGSHSLTRREVLNSIVILGSGALLHPLHAQHRDTSAPAVIKGTLKDAATGAPVAPKIRAGVEGLCSPLASAANAEASIRLPSSAN
jgi:hypothetical protein